MATTAELRRAVLRAESELDRHDRALRGVQDLAAAIQAELAKMTESERQLLTGLYYADQLNQLTNPNFGRLLALTTARDAAAAALDAIRAELATAVAAEPSIWSGGDPTPAVLIPTAPRGALPLRCVGSRAGDPGGPRRHRRAHASSRS